MYCIALLYEFLMYFILFSFAVKCSYLNHISSRIYKYGSLINIYIFFDLQRNEENPFWRSFCITKPLNRIFRADMVQKGRMTP